MVNKLNVTESDYLGLRMDDCLSWNAQISKTCKNVGCKIGELKYLRKIATKEMLLYFYNVHIQPIIDYGITLWSDAPKKDISRVQRLQNICGRIITGQFDYNIRGVDIVKSLKWMTVYERANYFTSLLTFKCLHNLTPFYMQNDINFKNDMVERPSERFKYNAFIPPFLSMKKEKSFYIRGPKVWNALPNNLKEIRTLKDFKLEHKKSLGFT